MFFEECLLLGGFAFFFFLIIDFDKLFNDKTITNIETTKTISSYGSLLSVEKITFIFCFLIIWMVDIHPINESAQITQISHIEIFR